MNLIKTNGVKDILINAVTLNIEDIIGSIIKGSLIDPIVLKMLAIAKDRYAKNNYKKYRFIIRPEKEDSSFSEIHCAKTFLLALDFDNFPLNESVRSSIISMVLDTRLKNGVDDTYENKYKFIRSKFIKDTSVLSCLYIDKTKTDNKWFIINLNNNLILYKFSPVTAKENNKIEYVYFDIIMIGTDIRYLVNKFERMVFDKKNNRRAST